MPASAYSQPPPRRPPARPPPSETAMPTHPRTYLLEAGEAAAAPLGEVDERVHREHHADQQQDENKGDEDDAQEEHPGPRVVPSLGVEAFRRHSVRGLANKGRDSAGYSTRNSLQVLHGAGTFCRRSARGQSPREFARASYCATPRINSALRPSADLLRANAEGTGKWESERKIRYGRG